MDDHETITKLNSLVLNYQMPDDAKNILASGNILVICGVTASGKNRIANYLVQHGPYDFVVSHTTRKPRENNGVLEQNGKEYWFVSPNEMLDMVSSSKFVEVKAIHGETFYGTSLDAVRKVIAEDKKAVMEIDVEGALELCRHVPKLEPLFILPPSYGVWMERLGTRGDITDGEKHRRLKSAASELKTALDNRQFTIQVNHEVEQTATEIINDLSTPLEDQHTARELAQDLIETIRNI